MFRFSLVAADYLHIFQGCFIIIRLLHVQGKLSRKKNIVVSHEYIISFPPRQNGRRFADDMFRCIFVNEIFCILNKISLMLVSKGPIDNNLALV